MGFFFSKIIRYLVLLYVFYAGAQYLLRWKTYSISPKEFRTLASKAQQSSASGDGAALVLAKDLHRKYGSIIAPEAKSAPVRAGGLDLKIKLLHITITEYIAIISSSFPTTGRSGLHWSNNTCTVLSGTISRSEDYLNTNAKELYKTGDNFRHGQFDSYIYSFGEDTVLTCYGRGVIPVSSIWTTMGSLSTGDPTLLFRQIYHFGEVYLHNLIQSVQNTVEYYKKKAKSEL